MEEAIMKIRQCDRLLVHRAHLWEQRYGQNVNPADVKYHREEYLVECLGLSEERSTHPVVDRNPADPRPPCEMCATWICDCGYYRRSRANRHPDINQICHRCGEDKGFFVAIRHQKPNLHPKT